MPARSVRTERNGEKGAVSVTSTVAASTTLTSFTGAISLRRGEASAGSRIRAKFHLTISAGRSPPAGNFTALRGFKTEASPPFLISHGWAGCGTSPHLALDSPGVPGGLLLT